MGVTRATSAHLEQLQQLRDWAPPRRPPVFAFFNVSMIGHVNPTFPLVLELVRRGCEVHYFLPPNEDIRDAARASGAIVESYVEDDDPDFELERCGVEDASGVTDRPLWERAVWPLASTLIAGDHILSRCRTLAVQAVLYDPMAPHGLLVAEVLGVPCVSLVTYPGLGSMADLMSSPANLELAKSIRIPYGLEIKEKFGVDLEVGILSRRQYFCELNLITTSEDLVVPLPPAGHADWADELREHCRFRAIGCLVSDDAPHVAGAGKQADGAAQPLDLGSNLPAEELALAAAAGSKVIFAALGTMALSNRWAKDLGRQSGGNLPPGTTGKDFCQHVWRALFAAMRRLGDGYLCVVCVGTQPDALDFMDAEGAEALPSNVVLRSSVPQVEMLRHHTDAFISHMGFNSMQESLHAGVPLIAVPQAVDQPPNARKAEASGWGQAFLHPMETVTASALEAAIREVSLEGSRYRKAVEATRSQLQGGQVRAADFLMTMAARGRAV